MNTGTTALITNTVITRPRDGVDTARRKRRNQLRRNQLRRNPVMMMMMIAMYFAFVKNA
jgi:hypothetical protein